jgi:hypothetical protein
VLRRIWHFAGVLDDARGRVSVLLWLGGGLLLAAVFAIVLVGTWGTALIGLGIICIVSGLVIWYRTPVPASNAPTAADFDLVSPITEFVGNSWLRDGYEFLDRSLVWVSVSNDGPEAEFSARFDLDIRTARREFPSSALQGPYTDDVPWENTKQRKLVIGHQGIARLTLPWTFMRPAPYFWFLLPEKDLYGPGYGMGWILSPVGATVEFTLTVVNESTLASRVWKVHLPFDPQTGKADDPILFAVATSP